MITPRKRRFGALLATFAMVATGATLIPASATTTVDATEPGPNGPVVRDNGVTIKVDRSAMTYYRGNSSGTFAAQGLGSFVFNIQTCRGDNPAGTNNSPRTRVEVKDPSGTVFQSALSPQRNISLVGLSQGAQPISGPPSNTAYRGDFPDSGAYHGMSMEVDLTGKPAGVYTVVTTNQNMVKTGFTGACTVGTPTTAGNAFTAGLQVTTTTFEYRPWRYTFNDVFGKGSVSANTSPKEFQFTVGSATSPIIAGTKSTQRFYSLPGTASFPLPSSPQACVDDPSSCLPANAVECDPASAGCNPRIMLVNRPYTDDRTSLIGVFDLDTKAFIATASHAGTSRVLMSLGTQMDGVYHDTLEKLSTSLAGQGLDLMSILATEVRVSDGSHVLSLSLLNGLQIDPTTKPGGIQIASDGTVQAGVLLNIYAALDSSTCVSHSASSAESTPAADRFTRTAATGYTVTRSDLLPEVPRVGPLGTIVGGPLYHIVGKFGSSPLVNTTAALIGVDTAVDEPHGYPVWIEPFLSGSHTATARTLDFLGTATWSASETNLGSLGCLVVDVMAGTGVAVLNNPLPVGLGTVFDPLATPSPAAEQLTDALNDAVDQVVGQVATNPTVSGLLTQVTALLPLA